MGFIKDKRKLLNDDCIIRAVTTVTNKDWREVYLGLEIEECWCDYLLDRYFTRYPNPLCHTIRQFAEDHPKGKYVVSDGDYVVAIINGNYIDLEDSGDKVVRYYFRRDW